MGFFLENSKIFKIVPIWSCMVDTLLRPGFTKCASFGRVLPSAPTKKHPQNAVQMQETKPYRAAMAGVFPPLWQNKKNQVGLCAEGPFAQAAAMFTFLFVLFLALCCLFLFPYLQKNLGLGVLQATADATSLQLQLLWYSLQVD